MFDVVVGKREAAALAVPVGGEAAPEGSGARKRDRVANAEAAVLNALFLFVNEHPKPARCSEPV